MKNTIIIVSIAVVALVMSNWAITSHYTSKVIKSQPAPFMSGGPGGRGFGNDTNRMARMQEMQKQRDAREQEYVKTLSATDKANYEKMKKQMEEQRGNRPDFGQGFGGPPRDR